MAIILFNMLLIAIILCMATFVVSRAWHHPPARWFALYTFGFALLLLAGTATLQADTYWLGRLTQIFTIGGLSIITFGMIPLFGSLFVPQWFEGARPIRWIMAPYLAATGLALLDAIGGFGWFTTIQFEDARYQTESVSPGGLVLLTLLTISWVTPIVTLIVTFIREPRYRRLIIALVVTLIVNLLGGYLLGLVFQGSGVNGIIVIPVIAALAYAVFRTRLFTTSDAAVSQALESLSEAVAICDRNGQIVYINPQAALLGLQKDTRLAETLTAAGIASDLAETLARGDHSTSIAIGTRRIRLSTTIVSDRLGRAQGVVALGRDITDLEVRTAELEQERRRIAQTLEQLTAEQEERAKLAALVRAQELPVIPVYDGVLVMPLIGEFDARRGEQLIDILLRAVARERAHTVIIDITGVPLIDQSAGEMLLRAIHCARLLGAHCMLVGIRPEIAQSLVALGLSLDDITTNATLQQGLRAVLRITLA